MQKTHVRTGKTRWKLIKTHRLHFHQKFFFISQFGTSLQNQKEVTLLNEKIKYSSQNNSIIFYMIASYRVEGLNNWELKERQEIISDWSHPIFHWRIWNLKNLRLNMSENVNLIVCSAKLILYQKINKSLSSLKRFVLKIYVQKQFCSSQHIVQTKAEIHSEKFIYAGFCRVGKRRMSQCL